MILKEYKKMITCNPSTFVTISPRKSPIRVTILNIVEVDNLSQVLSQMSKKTCLLMPSLFRTLRERQQIPKIRWTKSKMSSS